MFLKIATTYQPATDLGYLLRKNPANVHPATLPFGEAVVFFPVADESHCEAVLMLDVNPIALVRGRQGGTGEALLDHYVNDRPYSASSFLSVAMARLFRDTMAGRAPERRELAETAIPLELTVTPLPCRGGNEMVERLFAPLGYDLELSGPDGDPSQGLYRTLRLSATTRLADALTHLYVLVPVLDNAKHYWVGDDEVEKLIAKGGAWLQAHPDRDLIANRYLRRRPYARRALALLDEKFGLDDNEEPEDDLREDALEQPMSLNERRYEAVVGALATAGARTVCDLGCGEGKLLARLLKQKGLDRILGVDVSTVALEKAERRLKLDRMAPTQRKRIGLLRGSMVYEDDRLKGFDAITLVEVIEHVDADRLDALERVVFGKARPETVIVSTPNREFNQTFEAMKPDQLRHGDHRFEWTRAEFAAWAEGVANRRGYSVAFQPIGDEDQKFGPPTQMAVFDLHGPDAVEAAT